MKWWACSSKRTFFVTFSFTLYSHQLGTSQAGVSKLMVLRFSASEILLLAKLWLSRQLPAAEFHKKSGHFFVHAIINSIWSTLFPWKPLKILLYISRNPCLWKRKHNKRQLLAREDYASISNCRTKLLAIFQSVFVFFCSVLKYLCIFPINYCGSPNDVLWRAGVPCNPVWETL